MTISTGSILKGFYDKTNALGQKVISSDFTLQIDKFEANWLLCKQAPWPDLTPQGEIEVTAPLGSAVWQPQQIKTNQQGSVSFYETVAGSIDQMLVDLIAGGGYFDAWVYEGTPEKYLRAKRITNCFLQLDNPDRDWENRSQPLMFSGTMFYPASRQKITQSPETK